MQLGDVIKVAFQEDKVVIGKPPAMPLSNPQIDVQIVVQVAVAAAACAEKA